jgi:hypothetical protein
LKKLLTTAPVLAQPDIEKPFDVYLMHSAWVLEEYKYKMVVQLLMPHDNFNAMKSTTPPMT